MNEEYQVGKVVRVPAPWLASKWKEFNSIYSEKLENATEDVVDNWEDPDPTPRTDAVENILGEFREGIEGKLVEKVGKDPETGLDKWRVEMTYYKDDESKITEIIEFTTDYFIRNRSSQ
jgi:hypothetical protein